MRLNNSVVRNILFDTYVSFDTYLVFLDTGARAGLYDSRIHTHTHTHIIHPRKHTQVHVRACITLWLGLF
jgi:hypothetical protein